MRVPWALPLMQAPIGPATTPDLVIAVAGVGGLGTLAASWTEPTQLWGQVQRVRGALDGLFCVNLVLAFDQRERLEVSLDAGAPVISFSWGLEADLIERSRAAGALVLVQVRDVQAAMQAIAAGADMVIAQGVEAGGHVQGMRPLLELVPELRASVEVPILAAGGIADAAAAKAAVSAGADAVACGTAFLAAQEADVHPVYLARLLAAGDTDTALTRIFDIGWPNAPHRVIRNETFDLWDSAGQPPSGSRPGEGEVIARRDGQPIVRYSDAQPTRSTEGDIGLMALYAGTAASHVNQIEGAAEIARRIASGFAHRSPSEDSTP